MLLTTSLQKVKGVGPKTVEQFASAGLHTVGDLIDFLPRKHEDFSEVVKISDVHPGKMTIRARCEKIETRPVRRGLRITKATLVDDSGKLQAVWFNQPYRTTQLAKSDDEFFFSGEFEFNYNKYQLSNPSAEKVTDMPVNTDRLLPVYRSIKGLKSQLVRKILTEIRPLMTMLPETLPHDVLKNEKLVSRSDAVLGMHFPKAPEDVEQARERLAFEELFQLLLASQLNKLDNAKLEGWHIPFEQSIVADFVKQLPFDLTGAQRRAAWEIIQDFEKQTPMNRLLQGDVGAGKTVVAGLAARQAASSGFQTALMAPTEILASQHAETLSRLLQPLGVNVGLLTGSVKGVARKTLYEQIANGSVDVVVGTHALIQETVQFHQLGFVVIDEQHRFGVKQRQELLTKSKHMPHLLAMTATPIPRSLALTVYGELDVSILNELPKGRKPIETKIWSPNSQAQLYAKIDAEIAAGRQGYVICSLIDDNPDNEIKSVQAEYVKLQNSIFKHRKIGLLHGKMKPDEKDEVMSRFARGEVDILVSTTVVEVGVDVANATVMIIENADRFGLSQLHQLRGRVGRSSHQSYCYLVMSDSSKPSQRLKEIEKSNDGFYLAEVDLKLRGPGEIYGRSQHGALNLQIATLSDTKLIARAQKQAKAFAASGANLLQYKQLAEQVEQYQRLTTLN
ncbi:MAG TPA: ATP-dependent DNA helicase RecG [Candidatus Saccharimonadales bacterium]|jgi:ATP-dependent DNA helicase RecG|nr:ATP-dependent DNA helicase RecG [Candidatus Saccharimonadales bacterium]